jgi:hypothetical protein
MNRLDDQLNGGSAFASEIKQALGSAGWKKSLHRFPHLALQRGLHKLIRPNPSNKKSGKIEKAPLHGEAPFPSPPQW